MKVSVFLYASMIFCMTLFVSVSDYIQRFNINRTLDHAYHRSLMECMDQDLIDKDKIKKDFESLFIKRSPKNIEYTFKVVDLNRSPKVLRIQVLANYQGNVFIYDETLVEEVVNE